VKREAESVALPHLYPPPPKGRGRIKKGVGVILRSTLHALCPGGRLNKPL